jgi:hypothetical protein
MKGMADFTSDQKSFFDLLKRSLDGEDRHSTALLLDVIERVLVECEPNWEIDHSVFSEKLREDIEVCIKADREDQARQNQE